MQGSNRGWQAWLLAAAAVAAGAASVCAQDAPSVAPPLPLPLPSSSLPGSTVHGSERVNQESASNDLAQRVTELENRLNEALGNESANRSETSSPPSIAVGGRFDFDNGWYDTPANLQNSLNTPLQDGTDFRRFRLGCYGFAGPQLEYKLEADFSKGSDFKSFQATPQTNIFITHAWIALTDLPLVDTLRIGHQKEYFTFTNGSSSNFQLFLERPYIYDAFENNFAYDNGVSINRTYFEEQVTSWFGAFWNGTHSQAYNVGVSAAD